MKRTVREALHWVRRKVEKLVEEEKITTQGRFRTQDLLIMRHVLNCCALLMCCNLGPRYQLLVCEQNKFFTLTKHRINFKVVHCGAFCKGVGDFDSSLEGLSPDLRDS